MLNYNLSPWCKYSKQNHLQITRSTTTLCQAPVLINHSRTQLAISRNSLQSAEFQLSTSRITSFLSADHGAGSTTRRVHKGGGIRNHTEESWRGTRNQWPFWPGIMESESQGSLESESRAGIRIKLCQTQSRNMRIASMYDVWDAYSAMVLVRANPYGSQDQLKSARV